MDIIDCYVDGSFINDKTKWAYILVDKDTQLHSDCGVLIDPIVLEGRQIFGELFGVIQALYFASENNIKLNVIFDMAGIRLWVADVLDKNAKPWRTNKKYTKYYRSFVFKYKDYLNSFIKVKGHSGVFWNEKVDKLVKTAQNITVVDFNSF